MEKTSVVDWYGGQTIFITGATGFMGKALVEKLLRSCPKVAALCILVRPKKGKSPQERFEEFWKSPVFDNLRSQPNSADIFDKLLCIEGDITKKDCFISEHHKTFLENTVTTVFHSAAEVRFNQTLKTAVLANIGGTLNVLNLARSFKKLKTFVYVSTLYCHCDESILQERVYEAPQNPRQVLDLVSWMDDCSLRAVTPLLLKDFPNTYAYTKCLSEELVLEYNHSFPVVVARPAIVTAAYEEPMPGWIDTLNGPTAIIVAAGKGVLRSIHCKLELTANLVPVDVTVNGLLLTAFKSGTEAKKEEAEVFHIMSSEDESRKWKDVFQLMEKYYRMYPYSGGIWFPGGSPKSSRLAHELAIFLDLVIPSYVVDVLLKLSGQRPFFVKIQKKIREGLFVFQYYTTVPWNFRYEKLRKIHDDLNERDKEVFYVSKENISYDKYMENYILGVRKYCLHEDLNTLPKARRHYKKLYYINLMANVITTMLGLWILLLIYQSFQRS